MRDILSYIISAIVDFPEKVFVEEKEEEGIVQLSVTLAKEDMGKIIGKSGRMIKSIRNVLKIPAIKQGRRIQISLNEAS